MHSTDDRLSPQSRMEGATGPAAGGPCRRSRAVAASPPETETATETATAVAAAVSPTRHLTQIDLARRWRMSERTLESWRWRRKGPLHLRIGNRVTYRLKDVLDYEAAHLREGDG
jgi:hypothetical protein